jgi:ribosomal protein S12 methylthiotransferase
MIKICLISLGCVKNTVDSEAILASLKMNGYQIVSNPNESDAIIINTCGFILSAKIEGINTILDATKYKKKLIVTGCLVERYYDELKKEIPEVSLWIRFKEEYKNLPTLINKLFNKKEGGFAGDIDFSSRILSTPKYTAYLKISEGCNNFCAFCAIPFIRGRFVSYDEDMLVEYTKKIAKEGVKEIVVIGQDPTSYGKDLKDKDVNLVTLLTRLNDIEGIESIRCLYLYPEGISDDLLKLIASSPKFPHYFDVPIQHANDKILKSMNRRDTKESMLALFKKIKEYIPDAILRTTVIVGFPGETEKDVQELKDFISTVKFNHLGVFTYSKEEGTKAYNLPHQLQQKTKDKRKDEVMQLQAEISYSLNKELVGKVFKGIIIGEDKGDYLVRCVYNAPDDIDGNVFLKNTKKHKLGDEVLIKITNAFVYDLYGEEA